MARPLPATESVSAEISRNLALELVRVTEAGALASARWMGRGDKNRADGAAVEAMRLSLGKIEMDGLVVIGEGEKDEAPMLYIGERIGTGVPPPVDIAVDPVEGTTLLSKGLPNALSVIAMAGGHGSLYDAKHVAYMHKLATGADAAGSFNIEDPIGVNLQRIARAKRMRVIALSGVKYHMNWAETESLVTRSRSGTVRRIHARHHWGYKSREWLGQPEG